MAGGGKGGGSAPAAPDPYASADAQLNANTIAGMINNTANHGDISNPYYSVTNKALGDGRYQTVTSLAPEQQYLLDQQNALGANMNAQAFQDLGNLGTGQYQDAVYNQLTSRLDPQYAQQQGQLQAQLANQGITPGSAAWNTQMDQFGRNRNDAYSQASNQAVTTGLQARNQLVNEAMGLAGRGQPQTAQTPQSPALNVQPPDVQGAIQNQYNAQQQQYNQQQQQGQSMTNGLFSLGSAALGGWLSDHRLKTAIKRLGRTAGGLPLYQFRYKAGGPAQIGVMAQDVERVLPAAVIERDGWKTVDYRMIG